MLSWESQPSNDIKQIILFQNCQDHIFDDDFVWLLPNKEDIKLQTDAMTNKYCQSLIDTLSLHYEVAAGYLPPFEFSACEENRQIIHCVKQKVKPCKKTKDKSSPYHNYQKHLNNALKKLIKIPNSAHVLSIEVEVASQIWDIYCANKINTKRILHYIFNEKNEHIINIPQLKRYGLWSIYQFYGEETFNQAKLFLSKLAIDLIHTDSIDDYLKTRKFKKCLNLKQYILHFKNQLVQGFIKRRIHQKEKCI